MSDTGNKSGNDLPYYLFAIASAIAALAALILVGLLFFLSLVNLDGETATHLQGGLGMLKRVSHWFDDIFFQYNLLLLTIAVSIPPMITLFYVVGMKNEKIRRLKQEMKEDYEWADKEYQIEERVEASFRYRHYLGSMTMLTLITLLGCTIILLLKPLPWDGSGLGVDYRKGANFLMLGPFMDLFIKGDPEYLVKLVGTLTAFQFGFLGAYVYFVTHLVRSYFTLDLTPNTFVASSIRMLMGAVLALVCAFMFLDKYQALIPVISFSIGFFPQRGLMLIERATGMAARYIGNKAFSVERYYATGIAQIPGMSYAHELRLRREGYDNVENLSLANPVELAIRTGFGYQQLVKWISQAGLQQYLRRDYKAFIHATGLSSIDDINRFNEQWQRQFPGQDPYDELASALHQKARHKVRIVCMLCAEGSGDKEVETSSDDVQASG